MEQALQKIGELFNKDAAQFWNLRLKRFRLMTGSERTFKRIASCNDVEQLQDYLIEILYALIFAGLGFQVEIEPFGYKGPDLRISRYDLHMIVEVTRFRKVYPGPPILDLADENAVLPIYGNPPRDIKKAFDKIIKKFPQIKRDDALIAIWNDDEDMEENEVSTAVIDLRGDAVEGKIQLPPGLIFILYGSKWIGGTGNKQLHCFPLQYLFESHHLNLQKELETSHVRPLIERALNDPMFP